MDRVVSLTDYTAPLLLLVPSIILAMASDLDGHTDIDHENICVQTCQLSDGPSSLNKTDILGEYTSQESTMVIENTLRGLLGSGFSVCISCATPVGSV